MVGDVVVAAGCIAYSGPFTPAFRQLLQQEWRALLKAASVPHTPDTNLIDTLQVKYASFVPPDCSWRHCHTLCQCQQYSGIS